MREAVNDKKNNIARTCALPGSSGAWRCAPARQSPAAAPAGAWNSSGGVECPQQWCAAAKGMQCRSRVGARAQACIVGGGEGAGQPLQAREGAGQPLQAGEGAGQPLQAPRLTVSRCCATSCTMYSLFHRNRLRSATCAGGGASEDSE